MRHGAGQTQLVDLVADRLPAREAVATPAELFADLIESADPVQTALDRHDFAELDLEYDRDEKILFCYFAFAGRPCFTPSLLAEAQAVQHMVRGLCTDGAETEAPLHYLVLGSRMPGVWNLGGDLELFATLIRNRDRAMLRRYAHACCGLGYANASDLPLISVALVQGSALGGGFETALSANLIVAERGAKFGLPEILFNLFPGTGAYSFLTRRMAPGLAERVIASGEIYDAEQLHAMGAIDVLAPEGQGVAAFYDFIGSGGGRYAALRALHRARRLVNPVTLDEMSRIADLWVEAALKLDEAGVRRMLRLGAAQERHAARAAT